MPEEIQNTYKNKGLMRLVKAIGYSFQGLKFALKNEAAFRQEFIAFLLLAPLALWLDIQSTEKLFLILALVSVMVIELLNSAIEAVVDRISYEHNPLAGAAKDMGSLAVMISLIACIAIWLVILLPHFYRQLA
jgi:diacylglycerol kinase (ATP)